MLARRLLAVLLVIRVMVIAAFCGVRRLSL
jgi:hypothetical protein